MNAPLPLQRLAPPAGELPAGRPLRIALVSAHDRTGGAGVAAARQRDGLRALGHEAVLHVQTQDVAHPATLGPRGGAQRLFNRVRSDLDRLPLRRWPLAGPFSVNWLPRVAPSLAPLQSAELVHLHWINAGDLSVRDVARLRPPVVWTLHDMWAFTGGCHYDGGCGRFTAGCGRCPVLGSQRIDDLSSQRWHAKRERWSRRALTLIAPSRWLADAAAHSPVLAGQRIEVIRNGIDLARFRPLPREFARLALGLPAGRPVVGFGALHPDADTRKGYDLLRDALGRLVHELGPEGFVLLVTGSNPPREERLHGVRAFHLGHLHDDAALALAYAACDVFVAPSRQENLPNTVAEALACGRPCVAFGIGGLPDLIGHGRHGWLAQPFDTDDLAAGLLWGLDRGDGRWAGLAAAARHFAERHLDLRTQTLRTVALYRELLARRADDGDRA